MKLAACGKQAAGLSATTDPLFQGVSAVTDKAHRTAVPTKGKPVVSDNRPKRSPEMIAKLVGLGVPPALAADFPLGPHPTGRWCKKILGKVEFFGKLADGWQVALATYNADKESLFAGRKPERRCDGLRLLDLCNRFLHYKRSLIQSGELATRTWRDYYFTAERLMKVLGENRLVEDMGPADFEKLRAEFGKTWGPVKMKNEITRTRMIFGYAFEQDLVEKPIKFGVAFEAPDKEVLRRHRARIRVKHGARMFEAAEIRRIMEAADAGMKAMVLLAANGGLGNMDLAQLPMNAVDLDKAMIDFPRPKTGIDRKIPLWPETVAAVKAWLAVRPEPKDADHAHLLFLTKQRRAWFRPGHFVEVDGETEVKGVNNPLSQAFKWLMKKLDLNGGRGFYSLRHGFETVAGDTGDQVAVDAIMGHADSSMAANYRERIDADRLRKVTEHVRAWLFGR